MSTPAAGPTPTVFDVARLFIRHPLRWLLPAAIVAAGASAYALLKPATWEASQALMVRAEAGNNPGGPGRFRDLSEMKTFQETVLEVAKNKSVLTAALQTVGPPEDAEAKPDAGPWPSDQDVADLADTVKLVPPKGTEFGSTEVFYLKIRDRSPERAVRLADAVTEQLLARYKRLRDERAGSMVRELEHALTIAGEEVNEAVDQLKALESKVGGDLAELRNLEQLGSGDSDLRKLTVELENEVRRADVDVRNQRELQTLLTAAAADPKQLLATPNRLLDSQPALRRLKEGLIDAQIRTSQLLGSMSREHPQVRAALDAEEEIRRHLNQEVKTALQSVAAERVVADELLAQSQTRLAETRARLDRLAALRAEYSSLNAQFQQRLKLQEEAEKQLVAGRAAQAGAEDAALLTRVDMPDAGTKPVGPGRTTLLAAGILGGLICGVGCLLLTTKVPDRTGAGVESEPVAAPSLADLQRRSSSEFEARNFGVMSSHDDGRPESRRELEKIG
jgi:uncharacterized protein involved in exopolysaccharide biosynthesis